MKRTVAVLDIVGLWVVWVGWEGVRPNARAEYLEGCFRPGKRVR